MKNIKLALLHDIFTNEMQSVARLIKSYQCLLLNMCYFETDNNFGFNINYNKIRNSERV